MRRNPDVVPVARAVELMGLLPFLGLAACLGLLIQCGKAKAPAVAPAPTPAIALEPRAKVAEAPSLPEPASATVPDVPWQAVDGLPNVDGPPAPIALIAKASAKIEGEDPYAAWWREVPAWDAPLLPQQMAMPTLAEIGRAHV